MDWAIGKGRRPSLTSTQAYKNRVPRKVSASSLNNPGHSSHNLSPTAHRRSTLTEPSKFYPPKFNKMWSNSRGVSLGLIPGRSTLGPLMLILFCPTLALTIYHIMAHSKGLLGFFSFQTREGGLLLTLIQLWVDFRSVKVWRMIFYFCAFELAISKMIPGKVMKGPVTPSGVRPTYKLNGFQCYVVTIAAYLLGVKQSFYYGGVIFDHMETILASLNIFALFLCLFLYYKGLHWPSSPDNGSTGNWIFDYYWGTELHPRLFNSDVKQYLVCRLSMTFWALFLLSCAFKQYEINGNLSNAMIANVLIQISYITKFFIWEAGYMYTMDMCHDRAGFYLCWGVLVWLPATYTTSTVFLVENSPDIGMIEILLLIGFGLFCIFINYDCDRQKQQFRCTQGRLKIWGADPVFIEAKYKTENDETKSNLLLASGYWALSRHFHYLPELGIALCCSLPAGFDVLLPHFYVIFLAVLLVDRAYRNDSKCQGKYGKYWDKYCSHVPSILIPGIW